MKETQNIMTNIVTSDELSVTNSAKFFNVIVYRENMYFSK